MAELNENIISIWCWMGRIVQNMNGFHLKTLLRRLLNSEIDENAEKMHLTLLIKFLISPAANSISS